MASSVKIEGLPVTLNDGSLKSQEQSKGSAMTKKGVYAAVSYMASAGNTFFSFICLESFHERTFHALYTLKVAME